MTLDATTTPGDAATPPDISVDVLVCGALWVEYVLDVEHRNFLGAKRYWEDLMKRAPATTGQLEVSIQNETQNLGANAWRIASELATLGYSVALWSNPLGSDPNARMFKRALETLPNLHLLQPFTNGETPYVIRAPMPDWVTLHFWRLHADTQVLPPTDAELPRFRAAIITDHSWLDPTSANVWNSTAYQWSKRAPVFDVMEENGSPVEWARATLGER